VGELDAPDGVVYREDRGWRKAGLVLKCCDMPRNVLKRPALDKTEFFGMITVSPEMRAFFRLVERVARTRSSILVRGETGTGKERVARAIHALSRRAAGPFHAVNCATFTPELLASELFGHVRGSFTGAIRDHQGLFQRADGGSVFLDEIAELPLDLQARLLRVLQEKTFVPVGGTRPVHVDVRLISATHRALRREVEARRFREDLMYRIRVVPIFLPRLVEREGDIEALFWHFLGALSADSERVIEGVDAEVMRALRDYAWPGNIRELRNVVEYAYAVGTGPIMTMDEVPPELRGEPPPGDEGWSSDGGADDAERARIARALAQAQGRKAQAAQILGISRSTLWRKLREYRMH
jgi:transcriptional regulator with PAS, ATPase and Fis domain